MNRAFYPGYKNGGHIIISMGGTNLHKHQKCNCIKLKGEVRGGEMGAGGLEPPHIFCHGASTAIVTAVQMSIASKSLKITARIYRVVPNVLA